MIEHQIDDHHVFPDDYLRESKIESARLRDRVLNRTLIDRKTNIRISDRPPAEYMAEIREALGEDKFEALLASHLLPGGPDSPLWHNDFELLLEYRQDELWKRIQQVTEIVDASDLLEEEDAV